MKDFIRTHGFWLIPLAGINAAFWCYLAFPVFRPAEDILAYSQLQTFPIRYLAKILVSIAVISLILFWLCVRQWVDIRGQLSIAAVLTVGFGIHYLQLQLGSDYPLVAVSVGFALALCLLVLLAALVVLAFKTLRWWLFGAKRTSISDIQGRDERS